MSDFNRVSDSNRSAYSLATVRDEPAPAQETTSLLGNHSTPSATAGYGTTEPSRPSNKRLLFNATLKMAAIFFISTAILGGTLWLALPQLEE